MATSSGSGSFNIENSLEAIETQAKDINAEIEALQKKTDMNPADMLALQFKMNLFTQLNETTGNVYASIHEVTRGFIRNMKG